MDYSERVELERGLKSDGLTNAAIGEIVGVTGQTVGRDLNPAIAERDRAASRDYGMAHRSVISARALAWNKAHPEARKRAVRRDYEKHKARFEAASALRRAMVIGATIGNLAEIAEIYRQAREDAPIRCYLCGKLIPLGEGERHVDHVIPLKPDDPTVTPGKHCPSNLRITHATCNWKKNNFMVDTLDWVILGT